MLDTDGLIANMLAWSSDLGLLLQGLNAPNSAIARNLICLLYSVSVRLLHDMVQVQNSICLRYVPWAALLPNSVQPDRFANLCQRSWFRPGTR